MSYGELLPNSGIQGLYHLEDVNDSSGNARTLTNVNTVTFVAGKLRNCADLGNANSNKYLYVANAMGIDGGICSIEILVKLRAEIASSLWVLSAQNIITSSKTSNGIHYEYNGGTRRLSFSRGKNGVAEQASYYNIALGTSNWYLLHYTYDGTYIRGYLNGTLVSGPTAASGNGSAAIGITSFSFGANTEPLYFASALIDGGAIWNRVLSASEILNRYKLLRGAFAPRIN
jgi:hypothetical protein